MLPKRSVVAYRKLSVSCSDLGNRKGFRRRPSCGLENDVDLPITIGSLYDHQRVR